MKPIRNRIIPVLLLDNGGLFKTVRFDKPKYIGDPINAVRIFNEKEVDELVLLDIGASKKGAGPDFSLISDITSEAFMPIAYGGGISEISQVETLFYNGIEKVILNSSILKSCDLITSIANRYGSQAVVVSIDVKKNVIGKTKVYSHASVKISVSNPIDFAKKCVESGAGEVLVNSVDRDGTYNGYDLSLISNISDAVEVPVIACGGASSKIDFEAAEKAGASAMAAGSMFVYQRPHNAVLIQYEVQ